MDILHQMDLIPMETFPMEDTLSEITVLLGEITKRMDQLLIIAFAIPNVTLRLSKIELLPIYPYTK